MSVHQSPSNYGLIGNTPQFPSKWSRVDLGADTPPGVAARYVEQAGPVYLDAWLKFQPPGERAYLIHVRVDLRQVERAVATEFAKQLQLNGGAEVGRLGSRLKKRFKQIKGVAKKIASSKAFKAVKKIAKKALNNPLVKAALAATPVGAAALATRAAAKVAASALKGNFKAKNLFKAAAKGVLAGDDDAIALAQMLEAGTHQVGAYRLLAVQPSNDEVRRLHQVCTKAANAYLQPWALQTANYYFVGADGDDTDLEADAIEAFATAGAFEPARWLSRKLSLRGTDRHPMRGGARSLLLQGREAMWRH